MRAGLMRGWLVAITVALSAPSASAAEIRVMAAGSLKDVFTAIFADYAKQVGGSFVPVFGPSGILVGDARALKIRLKYQEFARQHSKPRIQTVFVDNEYTTAFAAIPQSKGGNDE
jgi:hypothetical protein